MSLFSQKLNLNHQVWWFSRTATDFDKVWLSR